VIYINEEKTWDKATPEEKTSYCDSLLEDVKGSREQYDLEWYLNYMFLAGNHYLSVNTTTNELVPAPSRRRGEVRMVVNKVRSAIRAVQNYVTREQPKWDVIPGDIDEETVQNARRTGKVMDYIYRKLHLEQMVSGVVDTGLNTSVGWVEVDWDPEADGGLGQVRIRHHDPYDVYLDKRAYLYAGRLVSRFLVKTPIKSVAEVKADKKYDEKARKEVKPDEELAASRMKAKIIRREGVSEQDEIPRVMIKEFMLWDDEKNSKGGRIKLFTYAGGQILKEEDLGDKEFPIYLYQISMNPLKIYQRSWTADAVPLNKALDRAMSQQIMYINQALIYRIIAEKGHGMNVISNEMGEIVEINKGREFQQMNMNPLPMGYESLVSQLGVHIEDVLGAHDAALGRLPTGARSGDTLEALQAADSNNLVGLTSSLESFLSVVGERILNLVAKHYTTSRIVKIAEPEEGQEYMKVIGSGAKNKPDGAVVITEDNELIVTIGSWLGHSKEAQRKTILELAQAGILPAEEVLRQFEFPNVEELSAKARDQRMEQSQMDLAIAGHAEGAQGAQGAQGGEQGVDMVALAEKESVEMLNGNQIPPTEGATPDHSQVHRDIINSRTFKTANPQSQQILIAHYQGEVGPLGGQGSI
jgi:hypothetical protein